MKARSQALSITLHTALILTLLWWPSTQFTPVPTPGVQNIPQKLIWRRPPADAAAPGGGSFEPKLSTRGAVPQIIRPVFQPPMVQREFTPKLILASGVDIAIPRLDLPNIGNPLSQINGGAPSAGPGSGGIGDRGKGPFGDGDGETPGGRGVAKVLGARPPVLLHKVEPDYSDQARKVRLQGTVLLAIDVDAQGRVTNVRVLQPLGLGLDEKAIDAVAQWRFQPATKDGRAIAYPAAIEVRFQLL